MPKRLVQLSVCVLLLLGVRSSFAQSGSYNHVMTYTSPDGWSHVTWYLQASGCSGSTCSSEWVPNVESALFERVPDRVDRAHGEGDGSPPSGLPVGERPRQKCGDGQWAAGTWHHNGIFYSYWKYDGMDVTTTPINVYWVEAWNSPSWEGWNFAHTDTCAMGTPTPGPTPPPTATPDPSDPLRCPGPSTSPLAFTLGVTYTPPNPIVVGQDPDREGVSLVVQSAQPGCRYYWWERVTREFCGPEGDTVNFPCNAAHTWGRYWRDWSCAEGYDVSNPNHIHCTTNNGRDGHRVAICEQKFLDLTDNVVSVEAVFNLTQTSRDWITNDLSVRYPGATIKGSYPWTVAGSLTPGYRLGFVRAQVQDPGWYDVTMRVWADGTCGRRSQTTTVQVPVYLMQTTIIR
ncbi:MAG: hypothetical protein JW850_07860 [Thermoflexales bacterium]|nr:hypothetical protein [Thermoflexales bacterium]